MSLYNTVLLLGTNLGDKKNNLEVAKSLITQQVGEIVKVTNILENEADGFTSDELFLNQKLLVTTKLSPIQLLKVIKTIEKNMGRTYTQPRDGEKYVDRIIDIDILRYNNITFLSESLTVPHHQLVTRAFIKELYFN
ncbi:MAG TPA: 2-amino-4-hydroxy-6-hydroxymethyldihydropteridine diphosphokinase [Faecalibacter sp.]